MGSLLQFVGHALLYIGCGGRHCRIDCLPDCWLWYTQHADHPPPPPPHTHTLSLKLWQQS